MTTTKTQKLLVLGVTAVASATMLGGCVYRKETTVPAASPPATVVVTQTPSRVVNYPQGRYELRGEGTDANPYYWVWIPAGTTPPNPPAPPPITR